MAVDSDSVFEEDDVVGVEVADHVIVLQVRVSGGVFECLGRGVPESRHLNRGVRTSITS